MTRRNFAQQLVAKAHKHNGMLLAVDGDAGIGKTFLLRALIETAAATGQWNTAFVRADEIEHSEPYSFIERLIASSLFPDWVFIPDANTSPVELARNCVQRLTASGDSTGNLIVIDDAQWIDEASQRVLRYVIPRVVRKGTFLVFGTRTPHAPGSFGEFLLSFCEDSSLDTAHHLHPLTASEISALVLEQYAAWIAPQTAQRILDATGGTFLGVDSVLSALSEREIAQLHLTWETDFKLNLQSEAPLLHAFRQLDPLTQRTVEIVCLAGHELTTHQLRQTANLLDEPLSLAPAIDAKVLIEAGYDDVILPRHALLAEAVAESVSADRARQVFRALAETTSGHRSMRHEIRGAESWHDELHGIVDAYVHEQAEQGNLVNASDALRVALTRADEPDARAKLLTDLALVHMEAKTSYLMLDMLDELDALPKCMLNEMLYLVLAAHRVGHEFPQERVQQLLMTQPQNLDELVVLAHFAFMVVILSMRTRDNDAMIQSIGLAKALADQLPDDPELVSNPRARWMLHPLSRTVLLDSYQVVHAQRTLDADTVRQSLPGLVARARQLPDSAQKVDVLVALAGAEVSIGAVVEARELAQQAVDMLDRVSRPWAAGTARVILVDSMITLGEVQLASEMLDLIEELAYATMDIETRPALAALRARIAAITQADDWEVHAEQARRQRAFAWEGYEPALTIIADCEAARVNGDAASIIAASEGEWVDRLGDTRHGFLTYRAHALIDTGALDEAAALIDQLTTWRGTRWLEYWGNLDWLLARLAEARGDHDTALWHYDAALERGEYPLPRSLTRADYGGLLQRLGRQAEAEQQLTTALAELERIGAHGYTERVRARLSKTGAPRTKPVDASVLDTLTEREKQIVSHLAKGRSNSQIAESLVVSVATVRTHVSNVLRKLKLSSRGEVVKLLHGYTPDGAVTPDA